MNHTLENVLTEMDVQFESFLKWLSGQYDPETGGFYYARSSRVMHKAYPDIESTAQALNILKRYGLLEALPKMMKEQIVYFFQQKQNPDTGYFLDRNPAMQADEVMVSRALSYSQHALEALGAAPLYPLPAQTGHMPCYLESPQAYSDWLRSIDLSNSWRGCDRLLVSAGGLERLDPRRREPYEQTAFQYFEDMQSRVTGLWGGGSLYCRVSGTFKLHLFYSRFDRPLPRASQIYDSILKALHSEDAEDMCFIRNPIHLLSYMRPGNMQDDLPDILSITASNMRKLLRPDGGFSRELAHSPSAPNVAQVKPGETYPDMPAPVHLGLGLKEGDMNAGTQAVLIRSLCYQLAGLPEPKLPTGARFGSR